jgi:hypothetical protein
MDRETVITDLQIIHTWAEFALERDLQFFTKKHLEDIAQWTDNALELMKEDCHNCKLECLLQKYDELKEKYDALLKEQETGHWILLENCSNFGVYCSECHTKVFDNYQFKKKFSYFCPHCGTRMEGEIERR